MTRRCWDCDFWDGPLTGRATTGRCFGCPPVALVVDGEPQSWRPETQDDDPACSAFRPREDNISTLPETIPAMPADTSAIGAPKGTMTVELGGGPPVPSSPGIREAQPRFRVGDRVLDPYNPTAHVVLGVKIRETLYLLDGGVTYSESELRPAEEAASP